MKKSVYPDGFLWGAGSAAHQVEGNNHNQWSEWELRNSDKHAKKAEKHFSGFEAWDRIKAEAQNPKSYISGNATNHYKLFEKDFDILAELNMTSYRFSIEWSRIEPLEGEWNREAVEHYRRMLVALKKRRVTPIVTLFHFTLPVWFAEIGGFEKRKNVQYFLRYVERIVRELGDDIEIVITINEPTVYSSISYIAGMWPPMRKNPFVAVRVLRHLADAHNKSYGIIKKIDPRLHVSISHNSVYLYPGDTSLISRFGVKIATALTDDFILKRVYKKCDFLGVNYYMSYAMEALKLVLPKGPRSDLNWSFAPKDMKHVLARLYRTYKLPIIVTENGIADATDMYREQWIKSTLEAIEDSLKEGVDVRGYIHWSLTDNFEWAFGTWPRFGLVHIDYETGVRTIRPSARYFASEIARIQNSK